MYNFYKKSIHGQDALWFLGQLLKKKMRPLRGYLQYLGYYSMYPLLEHKQT